MALKGDNLVLSNNAIILWDGITRPELKDDGKGGKFNQYSLKVAVPANDPVVAEIQQIATVALQNDSKFRGTLPPGGSWPILPVDPSQFEGKLQGYVAFNAKSNRAVQVFNVNNQELDPMQYATQLYPGSTVQVLVHAFSFDNKSKGIALGLDGIRIVDATSPRLPVGGVDAGAVFGTAPVAGGQAPAAAPPVYQAPAAAPPVYQAPAAAPPVYQAPAAAPPVYQAPAAAPPAAPGAVGLPPGVQPAPDVLNPPAAPARQMTPAANGATYEQMIAAGWTDTTLIQHGMMMA